MSQIEIKRVFSLANVLTILRHYHLQVKSLDQILIVVITHLTCITNVNFKNHIKVEVVLVKQRVNASYSGSV